MTISHPRSQDPKAQLRKIMGFWDVLLFNIATVLGPRWIAAAGHNGTSSISLWVLAAVFFFAPGALVINELSSRFPEEGGLYASGQTHLKIDPTTECAFRQACNPIPHTPSKKKQAPPPTDLN